MSKTIAIVSNTSWFIYNFHRALLKTLQKDGYKVIAVAPHDAYSQKLEAFGIEYHDIKINSKGTSPLEDIKLIFAFYRLYKKIAPDILLHYTIKPNIYGSLAARMLKIPVISSITGLGTVFITKSFSSKVAKMLYRHALKFNRKVFFLNEHDRELFLVSKLVKEHKAALMPGSGIDTEMFKPSEGRSDEEYVFRFLFIGRLLKDKGIEEFVHAAKVIGVQGSGFRGQEGQEVEFCILGAFYSGNPTAVSEDEMRKWKSEGAVKYLGSSDNVQSEIAKSDCVVLPSYREGLSRVLLEAASMAKPIVASDVPGCQEVVDDGVNGYLCKVRNIESLAHEMKKMLSLSNEERENMGRHGREKMINDFDEKIVNDMYRDTIEALLH